jgi:hypothetical protein
MRKKQPTRHWRDATKTIPGALTLVKEAEPSVLEPLFYLSAIHSGGMGWTPARSTTKYYCLLRLGLRLPCQAKRSSRPSHYASQELTFPVTLLT